MLVCRFLLVLMGALLAYGQVPSEASLAIFLKVVSPPGLLSPESQAAFLEGSGLSSEQIPILLHIAPGASVLHNLESEAARLRKQPGANFIEVERQRREFLHQFATALEERLGVEGWNKFQSFLLSIQQKTRVRRNLCDGKAVVYTFGTLVQSDRALTGIAIAMADSYTNDDRLYVEATVRSPENRELTAKAPASSFRIHAAAVAPLDIGLEDGTYQVNYRFGAFCGADKTLRLYTEP